MKLKLISWNLRGVNDKDKKVTVSALIRSHRVDLVCLQETNVQAMMNGIIQSQGGNRWS